MKSRSIMLWGLCLTCTGMSVTVVTAAGPELVRPEDRVETITTYQPETDRNTIEQVNVEKSQPAVSESSRANRPSFPLYGKRQNKRQQNAAAIVRMAFKQSAGAPIPPPAPQSQYSPPAAHLHQPAPVYSPTPSYSPVPYDYPPNNVNVYQAETAYPMMVSPYETGACESGLCESGVCDHCGKRGWCSAHREYSLCHDCSCDNNICVENFKRRWPGKTCLDRWFCDPWLRAYTIQPAGCCESKTWYKFE
ncbi:hypothetical protein Pla110_33380 [Polystyrenella longa]|uniref:Post-SET domain-containing protein n=1 Tax=Polystyrenella longa TaxID=2528007 RepID=A0A518CQU0_9PLAN|nr:hypothetical protein [Polystyrenella longa]QDU81596.1 hypothetical protein Pla110_33380 [Polystyrenella longa]